MFHLRSWLMIVILSTLLPRLGSWLVVVVYIHDAVLVLYIAWRWHHALREIITILQLNLVALRRFAIVGAGTTARSQGCGALVPGDLHVARLGGVQLGASLFLLCLKAVILCLLTVRILVLWSTKHVNATVSSSIFGRLWMIVSSRKTMNLKKENIKKRKRKKVTYWLHDSTQQRASHHCLHHLGSTSWYQDFHPWFSCCRSQLFSNQWYNF